MGPKKESKIARKTPRKPRFLANSIAEIQRKGLENQRRLEFFTGNFIASDKPKTIVNAGIDGQSTVGHIRAFDLWLRRITGLQAKWILVYVGINDMNLKRRVMSDGMIADSKTIKQHIVENSALYFLYRTVRGMLWARAIQVTHGTPIPGDSWIPMPSPPATTDDEKEQLVAYEQRLRVISRKIREFGAHPIFVTQPMAIAKVINGKAFLRAGQDAHVFFTLNRLNSRLMTVCRSLVNSICIDLANELTLEASDFYDRVHYTPEGAAKIGRYLYSVLAKERL